MKEKFIEAMGYLPTINVYITYNGELVSNIFLDVDRLEIEKDNIGLMDLNDNVFYVKYDDIAAISDDEKFIIMKGDFKVEITCV